MRPETGAAARRTGAPLPERTGLPVDRIAADARLGTGGSLRPRFRAELGVSPSAHRTTFRDRDTGDVLR